MFNISNRSCKRLVGVYPLLSAAVIHCLFNECPIDFGVGKNAVRTLDFQKELVAKGASKALNSKHLIQHDGFSHAVDLYPSGYKTIEQIPESSWKSLRDAMERSSRLFSLELEYGYDWGWDKPHFQIKRIVRK